MIPGKPFMRGHKVMVQCPDCGKIVRMNKPILSDLHLCSGRTDDATV